MWSTWKSEVKLLPPRGREVLFRALSRSFALFCGLAFALLCVPFRSFALICVFLRLRLERPRLGTAENTRALGLPGPHSKMSRWTSVEGHQDHSPKCTAEETPLKQLSQGPPLHRVSAQLHTCAGTPCRAALVALHVSQSRFPGVRHYL